MTRHALFPALLAAGTASAAIVAACTPEGPDDAGLERADLGTFTTDTGGFVDVELDVPEEAVSTLLYCGPYGYETLATAAAITAPDEASVYDYEDPYATPMRVGEHADLLPILVPVSPALDVAPGTWSFGLVAQADAYPLSLSCHAVHRVQPVEGAATVDLHLVFVGVDGVAPGLNEEEAPHLESFQGVLATLGDLWAGAGLSVGNVTYADFDGAVDTYTFVDGEEEFGGLLRTVAEDDRRVTFFFVQDIDLGDGSSILGLSGGPPGAAAVGGTSKSGVVVNVANFADSPDEVALIMAHEGGHFLGLFHPTEKDGARFDPLGDTPECPVSDGEANTDECAGDGAENVMWWAAKVGTSTEMSADQGWVVARSAATY